MNSITAPDGPDVNIAGPMMRTIWTLYGITIFIVTLRLYTQWRITRALSLGDAMMTLSVHHYGLGRRFFYLTPHQQIQALKFSFVGQPLGKFLAILLQNFQSILILVGLRYYVGSIWEERFLRTDAEAFRHDEFKKSDPLAHILAIADR
ncbi:hypothetical protein G7Y89_g8106 [Cudoniella acicularis]|uniref:Uncharacterized protein n=1 Tax=Cudoniella acicularis TaxID=354080 RepID=A0A8H4RJQ6_9HELO|nr:hypothetical protein G7Y89_g8106 [Cudoniella acicularis]